MLSHFDSNFFRFILIYMLRFLVSLTNNKLVDGFEIYFGCKIDKTWQK